MRAAGPDPCLLARVRAGETAAAAKLATELCPLITHQLRRYPLSDEDRRDVAQVALERAIQRVDSYRGESQFSTWLFRLTANEALMAMRAARRDQARVVRGLDHEAIEELAVADVANDGEARLAQQEQSVRMGRALAELPLLERQMLVAHYDLDLDLSVIAGRLGTTTTAVKSRMHRARRRLRAALADGPRPVPPVHPDRSAAVDAQLASVLGALETLVDSLVGGTPEATHLGRPMRDVEWLRPIVRAGLDLERSLHQADGPAACARVARRLLALLRGAAGETELARRYGALRDGRPEVLRAHLRVVALGVRLVALCVGQDGASAAD